jgi:hypothetical protein
MGKAQTNCMHAESEEIARRNFQQMHTSMDGTWQGNAGAAKWCAEQQLFCKAVSVLKRIVLSLIIVI